ncbi:hypothetical protein [Dictyobacter formicarum]|nr:hypothetical protein [Dictyobacter formicarum]
MARLDSIINVNARTAASKRLAYNNAWYPFRTGLRPGCDLA